MPEAKGMTNAGLELPSETESDRTSGERGSNYALAGGGVFAVLASACCAGPLILVSLGLSGAWIGNLTLLEPYRPYFLGAGLIALALAYWRIFKPAAACAAGEVCALPKAGRVTKTMFWIVAALMVAAFVFPYVVPLFY